MGLGFNLGPPTCSVGEGLLEGGCLSRDSNDDKVAALGKGLNRQRQRPGGGSMLSTQRKQ